MSRQSGFVPVNFVLAGKILFAVGVIVLVLVGVAELTGWFALSPIIMIFGIVVILVGLYLLFIVPRNEKRGS